MAYCKVWRRNRCKHFRSPVNLFKFSIDFIASVARYRRWWRGWRRRHWRPLIGFMWNDVMSNMTLPVKPMRGNIIYQTMSSENSTNYTDKATRTYLKLAMYSYLSSTTKPNRTYCQQASQASRSQIVQYIDSCLTLWIAQAGLTVLKTSIRVVMNGAAINDSRETSDLRMIMPYVKTIAAIC